MPEKKSFLDRVVELFARNVTQQNVAPHSRKRSLQMESLEAREMLTVVGFAEVQDAIEGSQSGYFRLERDETSGSLTVNFQIDSGGVSTPNTATQGEDYSALPGSQNNGNQGNVTFQHGEKYVDIPLIPIDDNTVEGAERVRLVILQNNNYTVDPLHSTGTLLIHDNDTAPNVWIDEIAHGMEGVSDGKFILKRDNTTNALTVNFTFDTSYSTATFGTDFTISGMPYSYSTATATFAIGSDTAEIIVQINDDAIVENAETVVLRLSAPNTINGIPQYALDPSRSSGTLVITDNDIAPHVWIDSVIDAAEPTTNGVFILKRSDTTNALTVGYTFDYSNSTATFGDDFTIDGLAYSSATATVTFAAGSDTVEIVVNVKDDMIAENTESVRIRLSDPTTTNGQQQYTVAQIRRYGILLVHDNDVPPNVWIDEIIHGTEGGNDGTFILKRDDTANALTDGGQDVFGSMHGNAVNFLFGDGSVQVFTITTTPTIMWRLAHVNDGETVALP